MRKKKVVKVKRKPGESLEDFCFRLWREGRLRKLDDFVEETGAHPKEIEEVFLNMVNRGRLYNA